jgi:triosephosphate isomerase
MAFVYEPEWTIGVAEPASREHVGAGCGYIRNWLSGHFGSQAAQTVRILYGGSVSAEHGEALLSLADVDGLGASRQGRDPDAFAQILRLIARARGPIG